MAVKTVFSEDELVAILSGYRLGAYVSSRAIGEGTVQTNYFLQTTQGRYVFRYYENRTRESVGFECNLIRYLKDRNYPCPAPLKAKHGQLVGMAREKPFVIFEFIAGQHVEDPSQAQEQQLIQKVAELHNLTRHYRPAMRRYRWNYGVELCLKLAQEAADRINTPNARSKLAWFTGVAESLALPRALPKGICHCDFHFSNILFNDGEFAGLIDFDDANYTYLTFDLATLMDPFIPAFDWNTWFHFERGAPVLDLRQARCVAAEYEKHRPLNALEKRHLFDVYQLSILLDCIWFFERGSVEDFFEKRKIEALNQLGRERFYRELFS